MIAVNGVPLDWLFKDLYISFADSCMFRWLNGKSRYTNLSCLRCNCFSYSEGYLEPCWRSTMGLFCGNLFFFGFLLQIATHAHTTIKSKTKKLKREWKLQKNTLLLWNKTSMCFLNLLLDPFFPKKIYYTHTV